MKSIVHRIFTLALFLSLTQYAIAQAFTVTMSYTPACSLNASAIATVTGGTPPYSYAWYGPQGFLGSGPNNSVTGGAGYYSVRVSDATQAAVWGNVLIPFPFQISTSTTPDYCNTGVGSATATVFGGGTPPFTFLWSNGATGSTINNLNFGHYDLTVTDANGCFVTSQMDSSFSAYVNNNSPITASVTQFNSLCNDGSASVVNISGGTAPYTYFWNSTPPQFTATASNLAPGYYNVVVTDAGGCEYHGGANILQAANGIVLTETHTNEICLQANGTASVTASGGQAPYTYQWSHGPTTQSVSGLSYGSYRVTVTDNLGCPRVKSIFISRLDPLNITVSTTAPSCTQTNGSATVSVTGGSAPYTYAWSNGANTATVTNLAAGYYQISVTDANGCYDHKFVHVQLPASCYATLEGSLTIDQNMNCTRDGNENGFPNIPIYFGSTYAITGNNGFYSKQVLPGAYVVSQPTPPQYFAQECPNANGNYNLPSVLASSTVSNLNFYDTSTVIVNDLRISFWQTIGRPGATQTVYINVKNIGSNTLTPTVNFTHDALMSFQSASWNLNNYNLGTRTLNFTGWFLDPGYSINYWADFSIPTTAQIGTSYTHSAVVLPIAGDFNPADNTYSLTRQIVSSYDPNRKTVYPDGDITASTDFLDYLIEFQNTGNDTAFTVELRDSLSSSLDVGTIEILGASHNYTWDIDGPGYLTFTFNNIMLPDSNINEPRSHGYIAYRIRPKANLAVGTRIENTAAIYFDYNAPVITNTTLNTVTGPTATEEALAVQDFEAYPNPANDFVMIRLDENWIGETRIVLRDLSGRTIKSGSINPVSGQAVKMNVEGLASGVYLLQCSNSSNSAVKKLVIQNR